MSGYDYGNARLRAMKSRLLSIHDMEKLLTADSLQSLIIALTKSAYREPFESALARASGMECIATALQNDLIHTFGKVRNFYSGDAGESVGIVLRVYDVFNLKSILRGLAKNISPTEILMTLFPVGELKYSIMEELTRASGPRAAIDLLVSMRFPIVQPLLKLRAERPGAETHEMELALEKWLYREALEYLENGGRSEKAFFDALNLEADLTNLNTVLRFAYSPAERKLLRDHSFADDLRYLLVDPGYLPHDLLANIGEQDTLNTAVEILSGTRYEKPLKDGLEMYSETGLLSCFEKQLRRFRLDWMHSLITKDPLGIGVFLGFLALKINEVRNIRWIAQGISLGLKADELRKELEFAR